MAHQLVGTGAADPLDAEGEGGMFEDRKVAETEDFAQQRLLLGAVLGQQAVDSRGRIAEPGGGGDDPFRVRGMGQQLDVHGPETLSRRAAGNAMPSTGHRLAGRAEKRQEPVDALASSGCSVVPVRLRIGRAIASHWEKKTAPEGRLQ